MPKKRAFHNFAKFYQQSRRADGFNLSMQLACQEASKIWSEMGDQDKSYFSRIGPGGNVNVSGPQHSANDQLPQPRRLGPVGRRIAKDAQTKMQTFFNGIDSVEDQTLHFVYVRTLEAEQTASEISIVRYSIRHGIEFYFHALLHPLVRGDAYAQLRPSLGDQIKIVRIKNTPNSDANRRALLVSILDFCDEHQTLLAPMCNAGIADTALQFISNGRSDAPVLNVLCAEDAVHVLSQKVKHLRLPKHSIVGQVEDYTSSNRLAYLRCHFHHVVKDQECSLHRCLAAVYAIHDLLPDRMKLNKSPVSHYWKPGIKPPGINYAGNGVSEEDAELDTSWT